MSELTEQGVENTLTELLNELLEYGNQERSFTVTDVDLESMKMTVVF